MTRLQVSAIFQAKKHGTSSNWSIGSPPSGSNVSQIALKITHLQTKRQQLDQEPCVDQKPELHEKFNTLDPSCMKRVIGMFRNKFVLKLENNNRGVLTRTRSKQGVYERDFRNFAKVEILYENGPIFATFRAISYIFVLLSIRHFRIIWHDFHSKFRMHSNKNLNNNKFL